MKRIFAIAAILGSAITLAFSGDVATLVNLGFSSDCKYFMFGQHGIDIESGKSYAEIYVVDTLKNDFVSGGAKKNVYDSKPEAGQDTLGAFFKLYGEFVPLVSKYKIDHLRQGRIVYLLADGIQPDKTLTFEDFKTSAQWRVTLSQTVLEQSGKTVSSFGLDVEITERNGTLRKFSAGNPGIKREGVTGYVIRQIIVGPDEKTIIFIMEKLLSARSGASVRYMVEAVRIP